MEPVTSDLGAREGGGGGETEREREREKEVYVGVQEKHDMYRLGVVVHGNSKMRPLSSVALAVGAEKCDTQKCEGASPLAVYGCLPLFCVIIYRRVNSGHWFMSMLPAVILVHDHCCCCC